MGGRRGKGKGAEGVKRIEKYNMYIFEDHTCLQMMKPTKQCL
jgi:hypothetical protein